MDITIENKLLAHCARVPPASGALPALRALLQQPLDWQLLLESAEWHDLTPLVYAAVRNPPERAQVPAWALEALKADYRDHTIRGTWIYFELRHSLAALQENGIDCLVLKGAALAEPVYRDIGLRPMGDIDLLVRREALEKAEACLQTLGYRHVDPEPPEWYRENHHHITYEHPERQIPVELHWHIAKDDHPHRIRITDPALIERWFDRARPACLGGTPARVLCPEDMLLHLALHFLKHRFVNHGGGFVSAGALLQLADIAGIIDTCGPTLDWDLLAGESSRYGVQGLLSATLLLALRIAQDPLDAPASTLPLPPPAAEDLATLRLLQRRLFTREDSYEVFSKTALRPLETERTGERMRYAVKALFPTRAALARRHGLDPRSKRLYLYYLLRPFELYLTFRRMRAQMPRVREDLQLKRWIGLCD